MGIWAELEADLDRDERQLLASGSTLDDIARRRGLHAGPGETLKVEHPDGETLTGHIDTRAGRLYFELEEDTGELALTTDLPGGVCHIGTYTDHVCSRLRIRPGYIDQRGRY